MSWQPRSERKFTVLFLSGERNETDGSRIYRCDYQAKQVRQAGMAADVMWVGDVQRCDLERADVVVFSRCRWGEPALDVLGQAQASNKVVCGDLDDRIYSPWDTDVTGFLRTKALGRHDPGAIQNTRNQHNVTLALLPAFDEVIVSTACLREELGELGIPAYVSSNAIDSEQWQPIERQRDQMQRLLFMTGTRTHDADFELIRPMLWRFLSEHPQIELTILGPLTAPRDLRGFPQIRCVDRLPMAELYGFVAEHDLCLVPLEATPFNDCKSALKFIECGLVSVPVIASPRSAFEACIEHGKNGFLAEEPEDWYGLLRSLARSDGSLRGVARAAHDSVLTAHTIESRGSVLAEHLRELAQTKGDTNRRRGVPLTFRAQKAEASP